MKIALINYDAGNLKSVENAIESIGFSCEIASEPEALLGATHLVLPGVGSFGDCMEKLKARGLDIAIQQWIASGKPYFGICLGYQILFESSEESPNIQGLGIFKGKVQKFQSQDQLKIPHMGWNEVLIENSHDSMWQEIPNESHFYYVHSYFPVPVDHSIISASTQYGADTFAAAVHHQNTFACQFHPEKSQQVGIQLLENFLKTTP